MRTLDASAPWTRVRDALASGKPVVAILPCGATEAHGPHLPLSTDVIIAEAIAVRAVEEIARLGCAAFVLPPLAYAPARYAEEFAGTISVSVEAAGALIRDIAAALKAQGFACLAFANVHFDPANVAMLREAANDISARILPVAFADFTRRKLAERLTEEFRSGACHAGCFETSLVLDARPDLVDETARATLGENPNSLTASFAKGAKTFREAGGPDAWFGWPGQATAEEGRESSAEMAAALAEAVVAALGLPVRENP